ncbi:MAG: YlmC/YmxH family sporulation protein [Massiliimalia sp.]|jgi:YlmC/YmxH family sporulation protein
MLMPFSELRNKEMICVQDGFKIGFVDDIEFDPDTHQIMAFVSYGKRRFLGLFGQYEDIRIPCEQIQVIGEDIILVTGYEHSPKWYSKKESFWGRFFE